MSGTSNRAARTARRRIEIYDTTLRDGTQGEGFNLSLQDKLLIARRLDDLGVDYIEGGFPLSNPKDQAFFQVVARSSVIAFLGRQHSQAVEGIGQLHLATNFPA